MSRLWLFISIPAAVVAVWLLVKTILSLSRSTRASVVATVPIRAKQQIVFDAAGGEYTLRIGGVDESVDYSQYAISISHPIGFTIVSHVVAILVLAFASLGSIIFTALRIAGTL